MSEMTKNILITGASGVIGFPFLLHQIKTGHNIVATFNSSYDLLLKSILNALELPDIPHNLKIIAYQNALKNNDFIGSFDEIWHFATYGQPIKAIENVFQTIQLNVLDTQVLVGFMKPHGRFYYASTSEMYGNMENAIETDVPRSNPNSKRAVYTESKRLGEALLTTLIPNQAILLRFCLVFSKYAQASDTRVLYQFVQKGILNGKIDMLDHGIAKRQYCYIDDALKMMLNIQNLSQIGDIDFAGPWNICNPNPVTIFELASLIANILKVPLILPPKDQGVLDALNSVSIIPRRYLTLFPDTKFKSFSSALELVVQSYSRSIS